ncbi:MAG: FMN-binding protein [Clostridia bacterium]|nr:FMN-binding protein [Clostridia bacterium]
MREIAKLGLKLLIIAAVAGLALGLVNAITEEPIAEQARLAQIASRQEVLPEAVDFRLIDEENGVYEGVDANGTVVGKCITLTVSGYAGEIEVTVGVNSDSVISGVSVGGSNFQETAGLGARVKEAWFTDQFKGMAGDMAISKDGGTVDSVASASISSRAVTNAVDRAFKILTGGQN